MDVKTMEKGLELLALLSDSALLEGLGKNLIIVSKLAEVGLETLVKGERIEGVTLQAPPKPDPLLRIPAVEEAFGVCWKTARGILDRYDIEIHGNGRGQRVLQSDLIRAQETYLADRKRSGQDV